MLTLALRLQKGADWQLAELEVLSCTPLSTAGLLPEGLSGAYCRSALVINRTLNTKAKN